MCAEQTTSTPPTDGLQMMNDFLHQPAQMPPPFAMDQLRRDLPSFQAPQQRTPSPGWAAEFDPEIQSKMETAFSASRAGPSRSNNFSPADFAQFRSQSQNSPQRAASPMTQNGSYLNGYQRPMGFGYTPMMGVPINGPSIWNLSITKTPRM